MAQELNVTTVSELLGRIASIGNARRPARLCHTGKALDTPDEIIFRARLV
jgi:hypothetical protein